MTRTVLHRGRVVDFGLETIRQPDGREVTLEIARHPGGAAVAAVDDAQRVCLLRQFRGPLNAWLWELPAGKVDDHEDPAATARRELAEEAGLRARSWIPLGTLVTCPGFSDETVHLYLARDLERVERDTEADEYIEVHWLAWAQALDWARNGTIGDAKTLAGLFRAQHLLLDRGGS